MSEAKAGLDEFTAQNWDELIFCRRETAKMREALKVALEMRKAQKLYFKKTTKENLIAAKRLEAALDMRLAELEIK